MPSQILSFGFKSKKTIFKVAKKPVYFAIDQKLVRRHKVLFLLAGLGQGVAILAVIASAIIPNIGNKAYAGSGAYSGPHGSDVFVMLVKTDNPGASSSTQFTVPTSGGSYNYNVDCDDDGTWDSTGVTGSYTCSYSSAGTYSVVIDGTFPAVYFAYTGEGPKLLEIQQWGNNHWLSMDEAFFNASNMQITASDIPDLSSVTSLYRTFMNTASMNADISSWDVSTITSMYQTFYGASSFNQPLNNWDVSHVTDMSGMFTLATAFNQSLSSWNTSNVTRMPYMFQQVSAFDQDISSWDVSSVIDTSGMFLMASSFNGDISGWDVSSVTNMESMFNSASAFNQDISAWDVSSVTNMSNMLRWTSFNQDISSWNVSNVTTMYRMFAGTPFNQDISNWDISSVTSLNEMFEGASAFNQPLNDWDTHNVTIMTGVFHGASAFNQPLDNWDTSNVTDIGSMFLNAYAFNQDLGSWNTSNITSMYHVFQYTQFNYDISSWDTSKVTTMRFMFQGTPFNQDISGWNTGAVTDFVNMFSGATAFNQDLSSWDVSSAVDMHGMFASATSFNQDIGNWDMSSVTNAEWMFDNSGISPETYDLILTGWSGQLLHSNVTFGASGKSYCAVATARQSIIENFNWTINDAGQACMPEISTGGVASLASDTATLEINIIDDGGGNVQDAGVQYGTDTNYGGTRSANSFGEGIQQVDLGSGNLQCETTYHYRAFIQNSAGTAHGEDATFTTSECPPPPQSFDLRLRASLLNTAPVRTGDTVNYQLKAKNLGPGATNSAIFYVNIPHETNYGSATSMFLTRSIANAITRVPSKKLMVAGLFGVHTPEI